MRLLMRILLLLWSSGFLPVAFAQDTTTRSGYAVMTLVSGNIAGLVATETLTHTAGSDVEQAIVGPSVLVTTASILVPVGPVAENTTAIALANPSMSSGGVSLVLTDGAGAVVLNTVVQLGPRGQFSRYLNEFFATQPGFTAPLLLTISAEIPVAILALNFRDGDFTSIPLTSLSTPTPVPIQPLTPAPQAGFSTGFSVGLMPSSIFSAVPVTPSIGGASSFIFPQVAAGGDWSTEIAIGNTSAGRQIIRIDFFGSDGVLLRSLTDIAIQPRGVFSFSTDLAAAVVR